MQESVSKIISFTFVFAFDIWAFVLNVAIKRFRGFLKYLTSALEGVYQCTRVFKKTVREILRLSPPV